MSGVERFWKNLQEIEIWLKERGRAVPAPVVREVGFTSMVNANTAANGHWRCQFEADGFGGIISSRFRVTNILVGEERPYGHPILDERARDAEGNLIPDVSSGVLALPYAEDRDSVLVWIKRDPGNVGFELDGRNTRQLLACAIQFARATLKAQPEKVPFVSLAQRATDHFPLPGDGNRSFEKWNEGSIITGAFDELQAAIAADPWWQANAEKTGDDFAWISRRVIREAGKRGWLNGHFKETALQLPDGEDLIRRRLAAARIRLED